MESSNPHYLTRRAMEPCSSKSTKLRAACNPCSTAKVRQSLLVGSSSLSADSAERQVKCSGERTGCTRCRNSNTTCIYGEAMVGKVSGARARRRKSQLHSSRDKLHSQEAPLNTTSLAHLSTGPEQDHMPMMIGDRMQQSLEVDSGFAGGRMLAPGWHPIV